MESVLGYNRHEGDPAPAWPQERIEELAEAYKEGHPPGRIWAVDGSMVVVGWQHILALDLAGIDPEPYIREWDPIDGQADSLSHHIFHEMITSQAILPRDQRLAMVAKMCGHHERGRYIEEKDDLFGGMPIARAARAAKLDRGELTKAVRLKESKHQDLFDAVADGEMPLRRAMSFWEEREPAPEPTQEDMDAVLDELLTPANDPEPAPDKPQDAPTDAPTAPPSPPEVDEAEIPDSPPETPSTPDPAPEKSAMNEEEWKATLAELLEALENELLFPDAAHQDAIAWFVAAYNQRNASPREERSAESAMDQIVRAIYNFTDSAFQAHR